MVLPFLLNYLLVPKYRSFGVAGHERYSVLVMIELDREILLPLVFRLLIVVVVVSVVLYPVFILVLRELVKIVLLLELFLG